MGGYGSGPSQRGRRTTCSMRALDVRQLYRSNLLSPGCRFIWKWICNSEELARISIRAELDQIILNYRCRRSDSDWQTMAYPVMLTWTACAFGGARPWFLCPSNECGRRVAMLFGGSMFACRHCHALAYKSQRETEGERATRRAELIRHRLGWEPGFLNEQGGKPKGMHRRTFEQLQADHDAFVDESWAEFARRLCRK